MPEKQILCLSIGSHSKVAYYIYGTTSKPEKKMKLQTCGSLAF